MSNSNKRMKQQDPRENTERAWEIAVNPREFSKSDRKLLMTRGMNHYIVNGVIDQSHLLEDVQRFGLNALDRKLKKEVVANPPGFIEEPGKMALLMALASKVVRQHPAIWKDRRDARVHKHVREYYLNLLYAAAKHSEQNQVIRVTIGELVYSRDQEDLYGPPVGNVIEGVTRIEGLDGVFFKIPLTHANRKCEARAGDDVTGDMQCVVKGKYVYVPMNDVHEKYEEYFSKHGGVAYLLEQVVERSMSFERFREYQKSLTELSDKITRLDKTGYDNVLFEASRYPPKLQLVLEAIDKHGEGMVAFNEQVTAEEIYNVVREYGNESKAHWVKKHVEDIQSTRAMGNILSNFASDDECHNVLSVSRSGKADLYEIQSFVGDYETIDIESIEDLLEFPCMESLHESLLEKKPVRWELYSFVRYVLEIDSVEFTVEDIKEWFSQYEWYREDVTEYQVSYEQSQVMGDGERPLPISCNNDNRNWAEHCIGKENCEYSLYGSVSLKPDVYERSKMK